MPVLNQIVIIAAHHHLEKEPALKECDHANCVSYITLPV